MQRISGNRLIAAGTDPGRNHLTQSCTLELLDQAAEASLRAAERGDQRFRDAGGRPLGLADQRADRIEETHAVFLTLAAWWTRPSPPPPLWFNPSDRYS